MFKFMQGWRDTKWVCPCCGHVLEVRAKLYRCTNCLYNYDDSGSHDDGSRDDRYLMGGRIETTLWEHTDDEYYRSTIGA